MAAIGVDTRFATAGHAQSDGASRAVQRPFATCCAQQGRSNALGLRKAVLPLAVFSYNSSTCNHRPCSILHGNVADPAVLTINHNKPDWDEDGSRFLNALYKDNTDSIVLTSARSAR